MPQTQGLTSLPSSCQQDCGRLRPDELGICFQAHSCGCWSGASDPCSRWAAGFPQRRKEKKAHTEVGQYRRWSFITNLRRDIPFRISYWSHRPTLVQCGKGQHRGRGSLRAFWSQATVVCKAKVGCCQKYP